MERNNRTGAGRGVPAWVTAIGVLAALVLLMVGIVFTFGTISASRWQRIASALRAEGQPLTLAEIEDIRPVVPDGRNAAFVVTENLDAISRITEGDVDHDVFVFGTGGRTSDFFSRIQRSGIEPSRARRDRNQEVLQELAMLAGMPQGRFDLIPQGNPMFTLLPHLPPLRSASKLLALDSILKLIDGDVEGAVRNVEVQFSLAGTLQSEPTMISRMVQIAIQTSAVRRIEEILRVAEPDAKQLLRLEERVKQALAAQTMKWALWGERAIALETLEGVATGSIRAQDLQSDFGNGVVFPTLWLPTWVVRDNQLKAAQMYGRLIDAVDDPRAMVAAANAMEAAGANLSVKYTLLKMLMPSLSRAMLLHARNVAHLRLTRAALAAERFRLDTGRFPASLDEIVPAYLDALPIDPFDGRPLRLVTVPEGIVIYSIGENGVDDGGVVQRPEHSKRIPDVGFRLHLLEHRVIEFTSDEPPG